MHPPPRTAGTFGGYLVIVCIVLECFRSAEASTYFTCILIAKAKFKIALQSTGGQAKTVVALLEKDAEGNLAEKTPCDWREWAEKCYKQGWLQKCQDWTNQPQNDHTGRPTARCMDDKGELITAPGSPRCEVTESARAHRYFSVSAGSTVPPGCTNSRIYHPPAVPILAVPTLAVPVEA